MNIKDRKSRSTRVWISVLPVIAALTALLLHLEFAIIDVSARAADGFGPACGTAVMDGIVDPQEWSGAATQTFQMVTPNIGSPFTGTLYVMNSGTDLYLGFTVNDDEFSTIGEFLPSGDASVFIFDGDPSGSVNELNNNVLGLSAGLPQFEDRYIYDPTYGSNQVDTLGGGMANGEGAASRVGDLNHFELRFPLCSGDTLDFCVHPSDTFGFRLEYLDAQSDGSFGGSQFFPGPEDTSEAFIVIGQCSAPGSPIYLPLIIK